MSEASYQTKGERAYEEGFSEGFGEGFRSALAWVALAIMVVLLGLFAKHVYDTRVEDSRAAFASSCYQADGQLDGPDLCRADTRVERDRERKECVESLRAKKMPMAADFHCDYDYQKPGHIIMIRDDERTWKNG